MEWYKKSPDEIYDELGTDGKTGLSEDKAKEALSKYGSNELKAEEKKSLATKLLEQFKDPLILILIFASIVSAFLGDYIEAIIIIAIVIINAALSLYQEGKAEEAIEALQKMSSPNAKVIRDGRQQSIPSTEIVPGDLINLETGDIVPADLRLIESTNLKIDESSLTGESVPVEKDASINYDETVEIGDRDNFAYSSTVISYGRGMGIAVSTGHDSEIGKIATTIQSFDEEETPLQRKLNQLSKVLGFILVGVCLLVLGLGLLYKHEIYEMFLMAISLAVAAIPEGLAAIVTIVLSLGMGRMAKRNAIVKKLLAVETLGTTTVICSDKTGTLTQNEMTVTKAFVDGKVIDISGSGYEPKGEMKCGGEVIDDKDFTSLFTLMSIACLANDAKLEKSGDSYQMLGDPTEGALITFTGKKGLEKSKLEEDYPRVKEIPFDSERKMMTTFHENFLPGKIVSFTKGAPDLVLEKCSYKLIDGKITEMTKEDRENIESKNSEFAQNALRVLAFAFKKYDSLPDNTDPENIENNMIFVGLTGMIDPARPEARDAIVECKTAGIVPVMITGDYLETAYAIGKNLGIAEDKDDAIMGRELNSMTSEEIREVVKEKRIFARVSPENKVQIVTALKENGHITAMTGDGVNDAPAIKKADIGVSMGITGTDVAKNTSDVILTDDNFATIVNAVEEGRIIYSNIKKFVSFLLSCNIGEVLIVFISILINIPLPLTPIQLLWLNLVTDSFPALALGVERGEEDIMNQPPRDPNEAIIDKKTAIAIAVQSVTITVATLCAYFYGIKIYGAESEGSRMLAFSTLITAELFRAYSARSSKFTLNRIGIFSNKFMVYATAFSFSLLLLVLYIPFLSDIFNVIAPSLRDWGVIIGFALLPLLAGEIRKAFTQDKHN
ncbi:MAG: calcium-translocating P-type ATPase, SERCA-type [Tissierellia bacterium]|nr:calcium-translocating P-type ATPase, SERCA-type [Tissierellia bacterium]